MASIHIKHVGPITDTGRIALTRVMLLLGPQGVGKSTLMKILCHCRWVEKEIILSSRQLAHYTHYSRFYKTLCKYHRLHTSAFARDSYIRYEGDHITIEWSGTNKNPRIARNSNSSIAPPKLSFIPAERSLVSVVENIDRAYRGNPSEDMLFNYVLELSEARKPYEASQPLQLSIDRSLAYYHAEGQHMIRLADKKADKKQVIPSYYAASGIQSAFPIDLISAYLFDSIGKTQSMTLAEMLSRFAYDGTDFSSKSKQEVEERFRSLLERYAYGSMQLYVEEPEQNLYPESQRDLLLALLDKMLEAKTKETAPSTLIMTTHSPYMLSVLNTQMAVARAYQYISNEISDPSEQDERRQALDKYLGRTAHLPIEDYSAYFVTHQGTLRSLIEDEDFPMVSGVELDNISDWVDEYTQGIYKIIYHGTSEL